MRGRRVDASHRPLFSRLVVPSSCKSNPANQAGIGYEIARRKRVRGNGVEDGCSPAYSVHRQAALPPSYDDRRATEFPWGRQYACF